MGHRVEHLLLSTHWSRHSQAYNEQCFCLARSFLSAEAQAVLLIELFSRPDLQIEYYKAFKKKITTVENYFFFKKIIDVFIYLTPESSWCCSYAQGPGQLFNGHTPKEKKTLI